MSVAHFKLFALLFFLYTTTSSTSAATWCVARSDASDVALQTALDYACATGADCAPLQSTTGLCYLPNTVQAHASYAFNSYYQRKGNAPGACSFSGTATVATTDPSYGSCVYPSSPSTAGGIVAPGGGTPAGTTTTTPGTTPAISVPPPSLGTNSPLYGTTAGGSNSGNGPVIPSGASLQYLSMNANFLPMICVHVFLFIIQVVYTLEI